MHNLGDIEVLKILDMKNHKDNELRKNKIFYTNWIEIGRKTLNQIDFTKEVLTKNKTNIILQRIAVEDKLLADELNRKEKRL